MPSPSDPVRSQASRSVLASGLPAAIMAGIVCVRTRVDPDLWGHLRFGLDTLASGRPDVVDPYSFTQDRPWINHEWLSEAIFAVAFRAGGVFGLLALKACVIATALWLVFRQARNVQQPAAARLLAAAVIATGPAAVAIRPQIWTVLALALTVLSLEDRRRWWWLPAIFAVWANLHAGWMVGGAVVGLFTLGQLLDTRSIAATLRLTAIGTAAFAATLLTPYHVQLWTWLASTVRFSRNIEDWLPLWQQTNALGFMLLWAIAAGGMLGCTIYFRRSRLRWAAVLPSLFLCIASVFVARLLPLFSVVSAMLLLPAWSSGAAEPSAAAERSTSRVTLLRCAAVAVACVLQAGPTVQCLPIEGWWAPDLVSAGALNDPELRGKLVVPFNWGQYAIWFWGPRLRVSFDGRRELLYSQETIDLQASVPSASPGALAMLTRERPEYVWMPADAVPLKIWLGGNGYQFDVETGAAWVARRADLPPLSARAPMSACFP